MTFDTSARSPERWRSLVGSVPIVTLGLLLVTAAMLKGPWPTDPASRTGVTVSYWERLTGEQPQAVPEPVEKTAAWYGKRALDGLALALLLCAYVSIALMILREDWRALILLTLIGAAGTLYGGATGLVLGPILTTIGFALVLFGAGLNVISQSAGEATYHDITQVERESTNDTHFAPQP